MTTGEEARAVVLERIRASRQSLPDATSIPRTYRLDPLPDVDIVERFAERVADYRATVHRATPEEVPLVVARILDAAGSVVAPPQTPGEWLGELNGTILSDEPALTYAQLDAADAVLTGSRLGIAETGTIVLDAGPAQGRRVLSLLPDHHVCVVREDQIVADVPQALPLLESGRPLTWISGPSATSDIELDRIEGVHGPRVLDVIIVRPSAGAGPV